MQSFTFSEDDSPITIGRINSKINIKSGCISKSHATIEYSSTCNQFYYKDMESTNGSTLIIKEDDTIRIKGEMKFKLDEVPFVILELP